MHRPGDPLEVTVERLAAGGDGVARGPDGITVFVPLAAPGDRLRVRVVERKRRFLRAEIDEVLAPGPDRTTPRCAVFGRCGGCAWQHVAYPAQLDAKRAILADALRRIGGHTLDAEPVVTPSPSPWGYRARARVLARDGAVGYRARRSHALCAAPHCPVLVPELEAALGDVAAIAARDRREHEFAIAVGSERTVRVCEVGAPPDAAREDFVTLEVGDDVLALSPGTFGQANGLLWETLHARVVEAAGRGGRLLELHAGAGFFTLALSRRFDAVVAVESGRGAVGDLRRNLARAERANVTVIRARDEAAVPRRIGAAPDVVVLDPPRTGVSERVALDLAALGAERIVYLSCDPATLARDTARMAARGYALVHAEGFDLFPQTPHLEALAVLALR